MHGCTVQEMIDRFMCRGLCRVASVFPYRTLKMMLVPQSLMFIIEFKIDSQTHFPHSLESVYITAALLPMGFFVLFTW